MILQLLIIILVAVINGVSSCFPSCPLDDRGIYNCEKLVALSQCMDSAESWSERKDRYKSKSCACNWKLALEDFKQNISRTPAAKQAYRACYNHVKKTCKRAISEPTLESSISGKADWLKQLIRDMRVDKARIAGLSTKEERHRARAALIEKIDAHLSAIHKNMTDKDNTNASTTVSSDQRSTTTTTTKLPSTVSTTTKAPDTTTTTELPTMAFPGKSITTDTEITNFPTTVSHGKSKTTPRNQSHLVMFRSNIHSMNYDVAMKWMFFASVLLGILFLLACALVLKMRYDNLKSSHLGANKPYSVAKEKAKKTESNPIPEKIRLRHRPRYGQKFEKEEPLLEEDVVHDTIALMSNSKHEADKSAEGVDIAVNLHKESMDACSDSMKEDEKSNLLNNTGDMEDSTFTKYHDQLTPDYGSTKK